MDQRHGVVHDHLIVFTGLVLDFCLLARTGSRHLRDALVDLLLAGVASDLTFGLFERVAFDGEGGGADRVAPFAKGLGFCRGRGGKAWSQLGIEIVEGLGPGLLQPFELQPAVGEGGLDGRRLGGVAGVELSASGTGRGIDAGETSSLRGGDDAPGRLVGTRDVGLGLTANRFDF